MGAAPEAAASTIHSGEALVVTAEDSEAGKKKPGCC